MSNDSSDGAIFIIQKTKITTCDVQGCEADANIIQTTPKNIYYSKRVYMVFCGFLYTCDILYKKKNLNTSNPYFWMVSVVYGFVN